MTARTGASTGRLFVWVACAAGTMHAAFSFYWATGGQWLLETVGQWAVELSADPAISVRVGMFAIAAVKLAGATVPVAVAYGHLPKPSFWRGLSWVGGAALMVYGAVNTAAGAAVLSGAVQPAGGYDRAAMIGHAWLWDPLFLIWGATLVLWLWLSRPARQPAAAPSGT